MKPQDRPWSDDEGLEEFLDWPETHDESSDHDGDASVQFGSPLPEFLDGDIAQQLDHDLPPVWFGVRWRDIAAHQQAEAWNALRNWVDWLIAEYRLSVYDVPACWYKHSNIVAELYAAMCMEYKVWEEQEPGLSPTMFWHTNLQQIVMRLKQMVDDAGCAREGQHKEPVTYGEKPAFQLDYDENDWKQHIQQAVVTRQVVRPATAMTLVRARIANGNGETVAISEPVGIKAPLDGSSTDVRLEFLATHGTETVVQAWWENPEDDQQLVWETSAPDDLDVWVEMDP